LKISTVESLARFIQGPLIQNLRDDAKNFKIILERDLEYRIYHHITNAINEKRFLIMGNKTISGIRTSAKTRGKKSDSRRFVMPDIMIRDNDKVNNIRIIMELKSDKADTAPNAYHNRQSDTEYFNADFGNLRKYWNNHELKKHLKYEFFIYLYRGGGEEGEKEIEEKIITKLREGSKLRYEKLIPIVINRYQKNKKEFYDERTMYEIDEKFDHLNDISAGRNNSKKISKKKSSKKKKSAVKGKTFKQRSATAKKAVAKMKWYRDHPKDPKSIEWAKSHLYDRYRYSKIILGKSWEKYATRN